MHNNYNRKGRSLLQRAVGFIRDILTFRLQWMHVRRRGETPNYIYLKGAARDRERPDRGVSHFSTITFSKVELSVESVPELNAGTLPEPPLLSVEKSALEESATAGQHQVCVDPGHNVESPAEITVEHCTGLSQEKATATDTPEGEAAPQKGLEETVPSSKKSGKNSGLQGHGQDHGNQMPLPFK